MANRTILVGQLVGGVPVHQQEQWSPGDTLVDPSGEEVALLASIGSTNYGFTPPPAEEGKFWLDIGSIPHALRVYKNGDWQEMCRFNVTGQVVFEGGYF